MSTNETSTEHVYSEARMPFRVAAGVLAVLGPLGLIPIVAELAEGGPANEVVGLAAGAATVLVCTVMFARTALTGRTPMHTTALANAVNLIDVD